MRNRRLKRDAQLLEWTIKLPEADIARAARR